MERTEITRKHKMLNVFILIENERTKREWTEEEWYRLVINEIYDTKAQSGVLAYRIGME
jgi:hypothetical protein